MLYSKNKQQFINIYDQWESLGMAWDRDGG